MVHTVAPNCHLIPRSRFARGLYHDAGTKQSTGGDDLVYRVVRCGGFRERERWRHRERGGVPALRCAFSSSEEAESGGITGLRTERRGDGGGRFEYLAKAHGWGVRRLIEDEVEMRAVARIQAEAFHEPAALFNDLFFQFFQSPPHFARRSDLRLGLANYGRSARGAHLQTPKLAFRQVCLLSG